MSRCPWRGSMQRYKGKPRLMTMWPLVKARIKLLFNIEEGDGASIDDKDKVIDKQVVKKDEMLMNREDMVMIKRMKRNGQRREEGVQVVKMDKLLQIKENPESHVERKRKNLDNGGEVSNSKRRMFGSK